MTTPHRQHPSPNGRFTSAACGSFVWHLIAYACASVVIFAGLLLLWPGFALHDQCSGMALFGP